ncbi:MAG: MMPL family transporter, partial [Chrysiogenetes bacterium]|nr:MMPL family transporter [Chrysiogenetes bacterium]
MVEQISSLILKRRKLILGIVIVLTLGLGWAITRLQIVTDFEAFFLPGDPDLQSYTELKKHFGSDEFILIAYEAPESIFTKETLSEIAEITQRIQGAPNTATTLSLTNAKEFKSTKDGLPVGVPIVEDVSLSRLGAAIVKTKIEENPFYDNLLVSEDDKTAFIVVQMRNPGNDNFVRLEMTKAIEEVIAPFDKGNIHIAGTPIYLTELYRLILSNLVILGGAAALLVVLLLWLSLRSFTGIIIPITILLLSVVWNMGIFGAAGAPLTIASSVVVPLIVAISVTNSIHFLLAYTGFLDEEKTPEKALLRAMTHIIPPAFYSSFTTAVGFLTLTSARVLPVVQTGLYTAAGVMASFVLTITVIPIVLSYFPKAPAKIPQREGEDADILSRILDKFADLNLTKAPFLVVGWLALAIGAGAAISLIRVETNPLTFFKKGSPMQQTHAYFEEKLGGTLPFEMIVQGEKGDFKDLRNYANLSRLERYLDSIKELHGVVGTPDVVREVHNALSGDGRKLPYDHSTFSGETRLIDLARNQFPPINQFIDRDWSQARFTSR